MAFVDPNAPEQQGQQPGAQAAPQAPVAAGGAGVAGSSKPTPSAPGINVPAQPSAQLSAYLGANQPQTMTLAQNIAGTVGGQVNAANAGIAPAVDTYSGGLYTVPTDAATNSALASSPSSLTPEQQQTFKTELAAASKTPNAANTFETTGAYGDISRAVEDAVSTANLWNAGNNVGSIKTAAAPFEAPGATEGVKTLDALLLSQNQDAYKTISNAVAPAANLRGSLAAGTQQANAALSNAISSDQGATAAANASAQAYAQKLSDYLTKAVADAQGSAKTLNERIAADLNSGTLTPEDAQALGITADQSSALSTLAASANADSKTAGFNAPLINLANYLAQGSPSAISATNTATAKDYADVAALEGLMGNGRPALPISSATAGQSGNVPVQNYLNYESALKAAGISDQVAKLQIDAKGAADAGAGANARWDADHFGGQTPGEFNGYIASLNARINSDNAQIADLVASANQIGRAGFVPNPGPTPNGQLNASELPDFMQLGLGPENIAADAMAMYTLPANALASGIGSVVGEIGDFLGFAQGGEVPRRPRSLNEYLGATA